jgi:hypothetical protein
MDKDKFTRDPHLDAEGFVTQDGTRIPNMPVEDDGCSWDPVTKTLTIPHRAMTDSERAFLAAHDRLEAERSGGLHGAKVANPSPWALLDQDHLDRIFELWSNSAPAIQRHLERLHAEATSKA